MKGDATGMDDARVEPRGRDGDGVEKFAQGERGLAQDMVLAFHAGVDEAVDSALVQFGQGGDGGVGHRVGDAGMGDVAVGEFRVGGARLPVAGPVSGGRRGRG